MKKIRIALVEDHDLTRVGLRTALQQYDELEVVGEAANAVSGLRLLEATQPDVAVVDVGLPDIDGIKLTQQLKTNRAPGVVPKTKVLILTLQHNKELVLAAFAAGADSYCMKDVKVDHLLKALQVTAAGNSWIDPAIAQIVLQQARQRQAKVSLKTLEAQTVPINAVGSEYSQMIQSSPLTERELEVLELIVNGYSNAGIAKELYITVGTVKTHVRNLLEKLCASDRTQAAVSALRCGLIS